MTYRVYEIAGAGFTLVGTIDEARYALLTRALDCAALKIAGEPLTVGSQKVELDEEEK